ncbi:MAG: hypothetical protein J6X33_04805 [Clostridiales bacterium]|nr:hypothetical protein [Clostridiales bacterium]
MKDKIVNFYLIFGRRLGKKEDGRYYLYKNGVWVDDDRNLIQDKLMGYDPYEPADSPYKMYNLTIMDEIEEIPAEKAMGLMGGQR